MSVNWATFHVKRSPAGHSVSQRPRLYSQQPTRSSAHTPTAEPNITSDPATRPSRLGVQFLTIPFAALFTLIAALIEATVLPELPIAGATADLVLVCAVCATIVLGIEDGLAAAFLGGLLIDLLIPDRPLGAATLTLLLVLSLAMIVARIGGPSRRWLAIATTVVLTPLLHGAMAIVLVATEGVPLAFSFTSVLVAAFMNGLIAIPVATMFNTIERRFGTPERVDW